MLNNLKQWILNRKFIQDYARNYDYPDRDRSIYIKAFSAASKDLEETRIDDTDKKAKELADKMLNDMLSVVDENKIISVNPRGQVYIGGELAEDNQLANLKSEAEILETYNIWNILYESPKKLAQEAMFVKGESLADMQKGKSILYMLATQKKILDTIKSYKKK
jgi:hypothetical protein